MGNAYDIYLGNSSKWINQHRKLWIFYRKQLNLIQNRFHYMSDIYLLQIINLADSHQMNMEVFVFLSKLKMNLFHHLGNEPLLSILYHQQGNSSKWIISPLISQKMWELFYRSLKIVSVKQLYRLQVSFLNILKVQDP
jgi:hypothetical protein